METICIRRAVAVLLLLTMLLVMLPVSAFADDPPQDKAHEQEETATVETTTESSEGCLETGQPSEDEPDPMVANDPESEIMATRGLHHRLLRSNTVSNGWGGIYARKGAGSVSFTYTRANNTTATFSLNAAYDDSGDTQGIGIVHYLLYSTTNDTLSTVTQAPVAYCIDPVKTTANYMHYENGSEYHYMMTDVLSNDKLNAIKLACAYGWPYGFSDAYSTTQEVAYKRQFATQIIIWEIVMGLRGTSGTYAATDNRLYDHYAGDPWDSYFGSTNDAYISAYQEISARLARHNTYPSFASSSASNASVYAMTYSGGQYTYTLTDSNGVLSPDFSSFSAPSGVTVTKNGNTLTITATEAAMANGDVTISMTGRKMQAGTTYVWFAVDNEDTSIIYSSRQPLTTIEAASSVPAYFKLKADTTPVSIKKTSNASASVQACIQDNPLYTLAGAKYEIYEGTYPNGTLRETLTTDINGNATGTVKYNIGTKLWAKEIEAPSGYLMPAEAQNHYPLTVSSGDNVFNVSDTPTFDPQALEIKKTGTDTETIQGAVFEVKYYAQYWINEDRLRATWYFMSDENGRVRFDDAHLLSSYGGVNSDPLYKPYGSQVNLPLGCAVVKEVKAANGYILPSGNSGRVCIFIKQGGPTPQNGTAAEAYWGDFAANPLDTNHPKDIYKIENDSEKQTITAVNRLQTKLEIVKSSTDGAVSGIQFEVEKLVDDAWTMLGSYTTNADGKISVETEQLTVGAQFRIREIVPQDYVCTSENPQIITLAEGLNTVSFANKPVARLEIVKTSTDGKVAGISFKVEKEVSGSWTALGTYKTDATGKISLPDLEVGQKLRITETVPAGYICTSENPQIITLQAGLNTVNFENLYISLEISKTSSDGNIQGIQFEVSKRDGTAWTVLGTYTTDANGKIAVEIQHLAVGAEFKIREIVPENYICSGQNPKTITLTPGKNTVSFENKPSGDLEIIKTCSDGHIEDIGFYVEQWNAETEVWTPVLPKHGEVWITDENGKILIPGLVAGIRLRITEDVPAGYICESVNPQTITIIKGTNTVSFENRPIIGNLEITKVDEAYPDHKLTGAEFTVTMTKDGNTETAVMTEVLDEQGNGTGVYRLEHIEYGTVCEIRETKAPEGYELSDEEWHVTIAEEKTYTIATPDFDAVTNRQKEGKISVHKEDADHNAMSGVQFLLEYSVDNGATWAPIQARTADDSVQPGYCTSEGLTDGILTTGADGNVVFTGLALSMEINSNVLYRLTEVKTQNGNTLMGISVFEGPLTIEEPELSYKVVNESVFTMPRTGGNGFAFTGIAFGFAILAAMFILFNLPQKRKNDKN